MRESEENHMVRTRRNDGRCDLEVNCYGEQIERIQRYLIPCFSMSEGLSTLNNSKYFKNCGEDTFLNRQIESSYLIVGTQNEISVRVQEGDFRKPDNKLVINVHALPIMPMECILRKVFPTLGNL